MKMLIVCSCCAFCTTAQNSDLPTIIYNQIEHNKDIWFELVDVSTDFQLQNNASGTIIAKRQLNTIIVTFDIELPSSYASDASFLFARTTNYKPSLANVNSSAFRGYSTQTGVPCRIRISSDGFLYAYCPAGSSGTVRGTLIYLIQ